MRNDNGPLVSIIMPCYNAEKFIASAIRSVLLQTYSDFELVIVNDGSTDNSKKVIKSFSDPRIVYREQQNKGQDAALNAGFAESRGGFIKYMDADDVISERMIELQVKLLEQQPNAVAYSEWYRFFGEHPASVDEEKKMWYWQNMDPIDFLTVDQDGPMLQCGIMMMSRELVKQAGGWDERLILYNDTEFFTRIILASEGIVFTRGARLFYRSGTSTSLSVQQSRKYYESTFLATRLIEQHMLAVENSPRVRRLLANIYFRRRYEMYPRFRDLAAAHVKKIKEYGPPDLDVRGGVLHNLVTRMFGWRATVLLHKIRNGF